MTYRDFAEVGVTAARHGVNAIQVTGWQIGGRDQNFPDHTIDPRLGTFVDFKDGIIGDARRRCEGDPTHQVKLLWADSAMDWKGTNRSLSMML